MPRKGENIRKRKDGRWEGRYKKGRNEKGTIIYGSVYGKTYREVREKLTLIAAGKEEAVLPHSKDRESRLAKCVREQPSIVQRQIP